MGLIFSSILDFSLSYELLHFAFDLNLWSDLGAKRNLNTDVPLRLMLKGHAFSKEYWLEMHRALIDLVRQMGYPPVFSTHSPLEWSWPYHVSVWTPCERDVKVHICRDVKFFSQLTT